MLTCGNYFFFYRAPPTPPPPEDTIVIDIDGDESHRGPVPGNVARPSGPVPISVAGPSDREDPVQDTHAAEGSQSVNELISIFSDRFNEKQVQAVYCASGENFSGTMNCLLEGMSSESVINMLNERFQSFPVFKIHVDPDEIWQDMVVQYKSPRMDVMKRLRIRIRNQPALDTGGVRRLVYSTVFTEFVNNKFVKLFDGPSHSCRPFCSAESRSCGLFRVLGTMAAHSICQDGIGFPYFSPTSFWYMFGGDERALEFASIEDIGADVASVVQKVTNYYSF